MALAPGGNRGTPEARQTGLPMLRPGPTQPPEAYRLRWANLLSESPNWVNWVSRQSKNVVSPLRLCRAVSLH
jgi:hypothetical protein